MSLRSVSSRRFYSTEMQSWLKMQRRKPGALLTTVNYFKATGKELQFSVLLQKHFDFCQSTCSIFWVPFIKHWVEVGWKQMPKSLKFVALSKKTNNRLKNYHGDECICRQSQLNWWTGKYEKPSTWTDGGKGNIPKQNKRRSTINPSCQRRILQSTTSSPLWASIPVSK